MNKKGWNLIVEGKGLNTYQALAENDYLFLKASMNTCKMLGNYNNAAILAQQTCEKYLKAIIVSCLQDDEEAKSYLGTQNLKTLLSQVNKNSKVIDIAYRDIKFVSDFYFDAKYPGDNFTLVNEEMFMECLEITEEVRKQAIQVINDNKKNRDNDAINTMKVDGLF